ISDAIAAGKKTIFVRNGTYLEPDTINIYQDGTSIIGESSGGVKIALQPYTGFKHSGGIYVSGYKGWYSDGSCRVEQGSATVTGYAVSWTSDMVGQCIQLGGDWHEIGAFGDTSTLTLKQPYYGITSTYTEYLIAGFLTGLRLENLSIVSTGAYIGGITLYYVKNAVVKNCILSQTVDEGLYLNYTIESLIENNYIEGCGYYGCNLLNSDHNTIKGNIIKQNDGDGLYVYYSNNNIIIGNQITGNEKTGLVVYASDYNRIAENRSNQNGDTGIWTVLDEGNRLKSNVCSSNYNYGILNDGSSNNSIVGCSATNNHITGIYIVSGSENTVLIGCHALNNGVSNLVDSGTNTQKGYNYAP
ncbi:MAG: right-handed parallel beta-helix repeat-containing protein, partial [bacterium]